MAGKLKSIAIGKKIAKQGFVFQIVSSVLLVAIAVLFFDLNTAVALAYGTAISFLPNAVFSLFAFRYSGASKIEVVVRSFSQGSKAKLAITIILFVVAFGVLNLHPLPVLIGFIAATATYWVALFRTKN